MGVDFILVITVFVLALFVGFELITKVPPTLHTPLMSGSNAISGIAIIGALIAAGAGPIIDIERVPLDCAAGRYAAEDIRAARAVPGHDNAAVDGYAVRHADLDAGAINEGS